MRHAFLRRRNAFKLAKTASECIYLHSEAVFFGQHIFPKCGYAFIRFRRPTILLFVSLQSNADPFGRYPAVA